MRYCASPLVVLYVQVRYPEGPRTKEAKKRGRLHTARTRLPPRPPSYASSSLVYTFPPVSFAHFLQSHWRLSLLSLLLRVCLLLYHTPICLETETTWRRRGPLHSSIQGPAAPPCPRRSLLPPTRPLQAHPRTPPTPSLPPARPKSRQRRARPLPLALCHHAEPLRRRPTTT